MFKGLALATALALGLAPAARASAPQPNHAQPVRTSLPAEVVEVQESHRSNPAGTIIGDAVGGALLGAAVGGGVALYNRYGTNNGNGSWGNWQRDIAVGAGIGLGVGLIVGGISAAANADRVTPTPYADQKQIGFAPPAGQYGMRF